MLYPCVFCVALLMDMFVSCVACLTVFVNCLDKQFAIFWGVVVILLLNVMEVLSVGGGALLDEQYMAFQRMCMLDMDEWFIRTVMALYTEACTVVRTDAGLSESFEVKVGLHQGSVLSPLLFAALIDVVSSEARSGLPSELLYADDLVLMAPTMEKLGRCVAEWS